MAKKLIDHFLGERVIVFIKSLMMSEQDEAGNISSGNLIARGYFLSQDKEYLYLGNEMGDVVEIIARSEIARISLDDEDSIIDDVPKDTNWN